VIPDIPDTEGVVVVVVVVVEMGCLTEITTVVPRFTWLPGAKDWAVT